MHFAASELRSAISIAWIIAGLATECDSWCASILLIQGLTQITIRVSGLSGSAVVTTLLQKEFKPDSDLHPYIQRAIDDKRWQFEASF